MSAQTRRARRRRHPELAKVLGAKGKRCRRARLHERDGDDCYYCLAPLGQDETIEHIHDWSAGGSNDLENLVLAHEACNQDAKDLSINDKLLRHADAVLAKLGMKGLPTGSGTLIDQARELAQLQRAQGETP